MYVIPILRRSLQKSANLLEVVWMFLERNGTHAIEVSSVDEALYFARENGFQIVGKPVVKENIVFLMIDSSCKELSSFYTWSDIQHNQMPMKEIWRPFLWVNTAEDLWGTNQYLNNIMLTENKSVYNIISSICLV